MGCINRSGNWACKVSAPLSMAATGLFSSWATPATKCPSTASFSRSTSWDWACSKEARVFCKAILVWMLFCNRRLKWRSSRWVNRGSKSDLACITLANSALSSLITSAWVTVMPVVKAGSPVTNDMPPTRAPWP